MCEERQGQPTRENLGKQIQNNSNRTRGTERQIQRNGKASIKEWYGKTRVTSYDLQATSWKLKSMS